MHFQKTLKKLGLTTSVLGLVSVIALSDSQLTIIRTVASAPQTKRAITPTTLAAPDLVKRYQAVITPEALADRVGLIASDAFEGRETTARGQKEAAQYLAAEYRKLGLTPKGTAGRTSMNSNQAYAQRFTVYRRTPKHTRLEVSIAGNQTAASDFSSASNDDLTYFLSGDARNSKGPVVFGGYGIADDSLGYNDYQALAAQNISLAGKWLMILDDEPSADGANSLLPTPEHKFSKWSQFIAKRKAILGTNALGFLIVRDSTPSLKTSFAEAAATASRNARRIGGLTLTQHSGAPQAYAISSKLANQLLAPSGETVEQLKQEIDHSLKPAVRDLKDVEVTSTVELSLPLQTENILAFIPGSDQNLRDEVLLISAHYDHLGLNPALKGDQIFNGAADDGSGVAATLELAKAFMKAKREGHGPRRSLLFVNFAGEEKGLLGSAYYTQRQSVVPLAQTVANINMDGVAGFDLKHPTQSRNYIYVVGSGELSQELIDTNQAVNRVTGSTLELTDHGYFPSDQFNFQTALVPFIYYSTGLTEHYHQPGDEASTLDYEHLAKVVRLVFATAWQVANDDGRPTAVDRSKLKLVGYVCPPCPYECDDQLYEHPGECPVCGMSLIAKYSRAE
jgi:hypothetical protein